MSVSGLRNAIKVPRWLANRPGAQNGFKILWSIALVLDGLMEAVTQGTYASWPGFGVQSADINIGRSRGFVQGPSESSVNFEGRLLNWLTTWQNAAGDETLLQILQAFIPGTPAIRIVNRYNNWVTLNADGTFSYVTGTPIPAGSHTVFTYAASAAMNWDGNSSPSFSTNWSDCWIIVESPGYVEETRSLTTLAATYADLTAWAATGWGIGIRIPRADVGQINALFAQWFAPHANPYWLIFSYGSDFTPTGTLAPNGYCTAYSYMTSGTASTSQRPASGRYWGVPLRVNT